MTVAQKWKLFFLAQLPLLFLWSVWNSWTLTCWKIVPRAALGRKTRTWFNLKWPLSKRQKNLGSPYFNLKGSADLNNEQGSNPAKNRVEMRLACLWHYPRFHLFICKKEELYWLVQNESREKSSFSSGTTRSMFWRPLKNSHSMSTHFGTRTRAAAKHIEVTLPSLVSKKGVSQENYVENS